MTTKERNDFIDKLVISKTQRIRLARTQLDKCLQSNNKKMIKKYQIKLNHLLNQ